jgi:methylthioribose-1-phosphate isomerase
VESIWFDGDAVGFVDQRALPQALDRKRATSVDEVVDAIATLGVRGAPAIGIFGAYGISLAAKLHGGEHFRVAAERIRNARPTAVNLAWAVDRVLARDDGDFLTEAIAIHDEQREIDRRIGAAAIELFPAAGNVLTHCNTGPLATGGDGTALRCMCSSTKRVLCCKERA